jgi:hypothetical protein
MHILCGSAEPAGLGEHLPIDVESAQLWHGPVQGVEQQTLSTQNVLAHSEPEAHGWPSCLGPQLPLTHAWPAWQSADVVQRVMHAPSTQR